MDRMYQYKRTVRGGLGCVPRATARNVPPVMGLGYTPAPRVGAASLPPGMGWTGGFTIPDDEQRFSMQTCSGSAAVPMDPSSDLICGMSSEVGYLDSIGCVPVGFRGSHHCFTDAGNQGIFHCCPPGVLARQMERAAEAQTDEEEQKSHLRLGLFIGLTAFAVAAMGYVTYADWKDAREEREGFEALGRYGAR